MPQSMILPRLAIATLLTGVGGRDDRAYRQFDSNEARCNDKRVDLAAIASPQRGDQPVCDLVKIASDPAGLAE